MPQISLATATAELADRDPVLRGLVDEAGPCRLSRPRGRTHFAALVRSIVFQQLQGKAATAIHERLIATLGGDVTPAAVLRKRTPTLRKAGLSGAKEASIRDLARHVERGAVELERVARLDDETIIEQLSQVRGIGRWTAEMFLMFQLRRLDVWPTGDYGVRRGYGIAWEIEPMPSARELAPLGDPFRPYRSIAAWYCWRATERP